MAVVSKKCKEQREISPERTKVWKEPPNSKHRKVPVLYYLSRNGQLQHPHFMEVHLSSNQGLYLRDVINRLNFLRGIGMASMYSWSCKRMYKNGFVWHDLSENDLIYPAHGQEYVLKGSELVDNTLFETDSSLVSKTNLPPPLETARDGEEEVDIPAMHRRRRNQSCSSIDLNLQEYCVYRAESSGSASADASTQTDDKGRRHHHARRPLREAEEKQHHDIVEENSEIEISPPASNSSSETLETLMKADGRLILQPETVNEGQTAKNQRSKTTSILMQLISCGSLPFKDCGPGQGLNIISQYKFRLPRSRGSGELTAGTGRAKLEGKEYFSGSIVETKKEEFLALKRSSSFNADR
ncbi:unnamed protein product [Fraxinus pennsylvanica]|uniref:SOSEKI DIX-like domain-containing protein n=1 Tax=Fraxinus pennsylvanica TaxID=56036 RepID=A0AAD2E8S6_9LAMI|nr:unnamed protein product [Fraxinus pennsylvanica]